LLAVHKVGSGKNSGRKKPFLNKTLNTPLIFHLFGEFSDALPASAVDRSAQIAKSIAEWNAEEGRR
jgi:hypothetical protein